MVEPSQPFSRVVPSASLLVLLALLLPLFSCSRPQSWTEVKAEVRRRYPDVAHIDTTTLAGWLDSDDPPTVIDARAEAEYRVSRIPGASLLSPQTLSALDGQRRVVFYCSVGYRSSEAARRFHRDTGAERVYNLEGSIFEWANEGRPLETPDGEPATRVHPYDASWGQLLNEPLRAPLD